MQIQDLNASVKVLQYLKYAPLSLSVSIGGLNPTGKLIRLESVTLLLCFFLQLSDFLEVLLLFRCLGRKLAFLDLLL